MGNEAAVSFATRAATPARSNPPLVAARVEAGSTYTQHGCPHIPAFKILCINDKYDRDTICAYRLALVCDAEGFYYMRKIAANHRYIKQGE